MKQQPTFTPTVFLKKLKLFNWLLLVMLWLFTIFAAAKAPAAAAGNALLTWRSLFIILAVLITLISFALQKLAARPWIFKYNGSAADNLLQHYNRAAALLLFTNLTVIISGLILSYVIYAAAAYGIHVYAWYAFIIMLINILPLLWYLVASAKKH